MQKQEPFLAILRKKLNASFHIIDFERDVILGRKMKILIGVILLRSYRVWKISFRLYKSNMHNSVRMSLYILNYWCFNCCFVGVMELLQCNPYPFCCKADLNLWVEPFSTAIFQGSLSCMRSKSRRSSNTLKHDFNW